MRDLRVWWDKRLRKAALWRCSTTSELVEEAEEVLTP
jgi:hypothetical protein